MFEEDEENLSPDQDGKETSRTIWVCQAQGRPDLHGSLRTRSSLYTPSSQLEAMEAEVL